MIYQKTITLYVTIAHTDYKTTEHWKQHLPHLL